MRKFKIGASAGFTILELIVVIGLLAILSVGAMWGWQAQLKKARDGQRKAHFGDLRLAIRSYYEDEGCFPDVSEMVCGSTALAPYLAEVPCDPVNVGNNIYDYQKDNCQTFALYTNLEFTGDRVINDLGCGTGCGPDGKYNYYISSDNFSIGSGSEEGILPNCPSSTAPEEDRYCFANECSVCCPGKGYRCSRTGKRCVLDTSCILPTPTPPPPEPS